ncbi:MAG: hypothetical protein H6828_03470 [Planctomycetes bacterium]|nr:hypothetical protein [Planctomycetota bacterium]
MERLAMLSVKHLFLAALVGAALTAAPAFGNAETKPAFHTGEGFGRVVFPLPDYAGRFNAVLLDEQGRHAYTLDAELTCFVPWCGFPYEVREFMGGVYGYLREAPPAGTIPAVLPEPIAVVQGTYYVGPSGYGHFDVHAFQRTEKGLCCKVGEVSGQIVTHLLVAHPPQRPVIHAELAPPQTLGPPEVSVGPLPCRPLLPAGGTQTGLGSKLPPSAIESPLGTADAANAFAPRHKVIVLGNDDPLEQQLLGTLKVTYALFL